MTAREYEDGAKCLNLQAGLRDKALEILSQEKKAESNIIDGFKIEREAKLKKLHEEREGLEKELAKTRKEYFELAHTFCKNNGRHSIEYGKGDNAVFKTCLICGRTEDPDLMFKPREIYLKGSEDVILRASEQTENLELEKTALRILEIRKEFKNIQEKIERNQADFEQVCSILGHEVKMYSLTKEYFLTCKCCGKKMSYKEYINSFYKASKRAIPFFYLAGHSVFKK